MLNSKYVLAVAIALAFSALTFSSGARSQSGSKDDGQPSLRVVSQDNPATVVGLPESISAPDSLSSTSTFYTVRDDVRRCVSPMCGGHFVKRVNMPLTRCADGRYRAECYVAEIDWHDQAEIDTGVAILRGAVVARTYARFGNLGAFSVTESWQAVSNNRPEGAFYRVRDTGVRCIAFPCPTFHEARLNSTLSRNIAGVDVVRVGATSLAGPDGVIVAGEHVPVTGPGGRSVELKATQIYLRTGKNVSSLKPCIKTGCSSQICADQNVISTCEWRPQYECYQKAACERQANGNCGFTQTRELTSCLAAK